MNVGIVGIAGIRRVGGGRTRGFGFLVLVVEVREESLGRRDRDVVCRAGVQTRHQGLRGLAHGGVERHVRRRFGVVINNAAREREVDTDEGMRCARDADETMRPMSGGDSSAPAAVSRRASRSHSRTAASGECCIFPGKLPEKHPRVCMPPVVPGRPQPCARRRLTMGCQIRAH